MSKNKCDCECRCEYKVTRENHLQSLRVDALDKSYRLANYENVGATYKSLLTEIERHFKETE